MGADSSVGSFLVPRHRALIQIRQQGTGDHGVSLPIDYQLLAQREAQTGVCRLIKGAGGGGRAGLPSKGATSILTG